MTWRRLAWMPGYQLVCQLLHTSVAVNVGLVGWLCGWPWWAGLVLTTSLATAKEWVFDLFVIERDSPSGSLLDYVSYLAGGLVIALIQLAVGG